MGNSESSNTPKPHPQRKDAFQGNTATNTTESYYVRPQAELHSRYAARAPPFESKSKDAFQGNSARTATKTTESCYVRPQAELHSRYAARAPPFESKSKSSVQGSSRTAVQHNDPVSLYPNLQRSDSPPPSYKTVFETNLIATAPPLDCKPLKKEVYVKEAAQNKKPTTTTTFTISPPDCMMSDGNLATNWCQWKQNFKIYLKTCGMDKNNERACALFLHCIGQYGRDIFNKLEIVEPHTLQDFYAKFEQHCNHNTSIFYNRNLFFTTKRQSSQTFDLFLDLLTQTASRCEFGELHNNLLLVQLISGLDNYSLRKRLLKIPDLTLIAAITECRKAELAIPIGSSFNNVKAQNTRKNNRCRTERTTNNSTLNCLLCNKPHIGEKCPLHKSDNELICNFCGMIHKRPGCPAYDKICAKCGMRNHFASVCKHP